jgi:hypothetical protein
MEHNRGKTNRMDWHTLRHNGAMKNIIEGKIEGKVLRGRPRDEYTGQVDQKRLRKLVLEEDSKMDR